MTEQPVTARLDALGNQLIDVSVANGYSPDSIIARADRPLRLTFHRSDDDPCTERVIFSSPHLDRYLRPKAPTMIVLPAQAPGQVRFTCAMGRYRGLIQMTGDTTPVPVSQSPARRSRAENPLGMAIMLWVCSLPMVGIVGLLLLGPQAAIVAAVLAFPILLLASHRWASSDAR